MIKKYLLIALTLLSTTSCLKYYSLSLDRPLLVSTKAPEGPAEYKKGWEDGCNSSISAVNSPLFLSVGTAPFTYDKNFENSTLYFKAWKYGYEHCGFSLRSLAKYTF